jgi:hypothetical protein
MVSITKVPVDILDRVALHLDFDSYDCLRYSFRSSLSIQKPIQLKEYQDFQSLKGSVTRSKIYRHYIAELEMTKLVFCQDYVHFCEFADLLSKFQPKALAVIFQHIATWPIGYQRKVKATLVDLLRKGVLRGINAILIFHELDQGYLPSIVKSLVPTKTLVMSMIKKNCIRAVELFQEGIKTQLTIADIYEVFLLALQSGNTGFSHVFVQMIGEEVEGDLSDDNTPRFGEVVQCAIRAGDITLLKELSKDSRFHFYNYGLHSALKDGHESTACFIIEQRRTLMGIGMMQCAISYGRTQVIDLLFSEKFVQTLPRDSLWTFLTTEFENAYALKKLMTCSQCGNAYAHRELVSGSGREDVTQYLIQAIRKRMIESVFTILENGKVQMNDEVWLVVFQTNSESMLETVMLFHEIPKHRYSQVVERGFFKTVERLGSKILKNSEQYLEAAVRSRSVAKMVKLFVCNVPSQYLHQAVSQRSEEIFSLLLSHYEGEVDLRTVVLEGTPNMLQQVLNAPPQVQIQMSCNVLELAKKLQKMEMVDILEQHP